MTVNQLKYVERILEREGLIFVKDDLAKEFSNGRTEFLGRLNHKETQALIDSLVEPNSKSKMKRKILSMAHEMRWELPTGKVDMQRLNGWCKKHTPSHTDFDSIPLKDLPTVVSIYAKMYNEFLKQL